MSKLRDFMATRRSEIDADIKALRSELRDIDAAEAALAEKDGTLRGGVHFGAGLYRRRPDGKPTLKQMAISVLEGGKSMDANSIRDAIIKEFDVEVPRESLSPQLSRLGSEGVLARHGLLWHRALGHDEGPDLTNKNVLNRDAKRVEAEVDTAGIGAIARYESQIDQRIVRRKMGLFGLDHKTEVVDDDAS